MNRRTRLSRAAIAAMTLAIVVALSAAPSPAQPPLASVASAGGITAAAYLPTGGPFELKNVNSNKCLEVGFFGREDFNAVNQYTCYEGTNQQWRSEPSGSGYRLINVNSGKCLEVGFSGRADFNAVNQYTCHGGTNQQWVEVNGTCCANTIIKNVNSGKCLEVGFSGGADFNAVNQYTCHGQPNQQWSFWLVL